MNRSVVAVLWTLSVIYGVAPRSVALAQTDFPRTDFGLPAESAGWDRVLAGLLSTFDKADVLALGDAHGRQVDSDLRVRLIQHPEFAKKVRLIVVEFGTASLQPLIDGFVRGDDVPPQDAQRLWMLEAVS